MVCRAAGGEVIVGGRAAGRVLYGMVHFATVGSDPAAREHTPLIANVDPPPQRGVGQAISRVAVGWYAGTVGDPVGEVGDQRPPAGGWLVEQAGQVVSGDL